MKIIRDIPVLENIPVLVRASLNVPVKDGKVESTFRLRSALPTIEYLRKKNAKVILISHISGKGTESLEPMWKAMQEFISDIKFCPVTTGPEARKAVKELSAGGVLVLENLRRNAGEEANDQKFAEELAELADVFVQDTFDVCHRKHAGVVGVTELLPSYAGFLVMAEVEELTKALKPSHPSLAVISGAKFATKQPVIKKLLSLYDHVFVGGALANDFIKAKGLPVGSSLVGNGMEEEIAELLKNPKVVIPVDGVLAPFGSSRDAGRLSDLRDTKADEAILDVGPKTVDALDELIRKAKTVLWNGPLGNYENGFVEGTEGLAEIIARANTHSIIGGGDTITAIEKLQLSGRFSFISTGGGAMLDFLASGGSLPGIDVLN